MGFVGFGSHASVASAHEVYVLTSPEVSTAITAPSPNPFGAIPGQELKFLSYGALTLVVALVVLSISVSRLFEKVFDPFLIRLKKYAPIIARVTFGLSVFASGYFGSFFGPELQIHSLFAEGFASAVSISLMIAGALIVLGFLTRFMALYMLAVFTFAASTYGTYMLTYANYLGEAVLFLILGGGRWSLDGAVPELRALDRAFGRLARSAERYSFLILRVLFGTALFFASFYAKFLHSNLALQTVNDYHLTNYFHFTPLFLVLGAFIIEALIGICFATGFEIRFAALFFTFFITISLLFFGETVWPHLILFGVNMALFAHGYDKYTLEKALFQRKRKGEPVL
ncbi:MAG: DoxX domain protein [Candidatus Parcubacteria bacterium]|nr:DoxX domain protein [Candidatus Parcubacteria bacterium]